AVPNRSGGPPSGDCVSGRRGQAAEIFPVRRCVSRNRDSRRETSPLASWRREAAAAQRHSRALIPPELRRHGRCCEAANRRPPISYHRPPVQSPPDAPESALGRKSPGDSEEGSPPIAAFRTASR